MVMPAMKNVPKYTANLHIHVGFVSDCGRRLVTSFDKEVRLPIEPRPTMRVEVGAGDSSQTVAVHWVSVSEVDGAVFVRCADVVFRVAHAGMIEEAVRRFTDNGWVSNPVTPDAASAGCHAEPTAGPPGFPPGLPPGFPPPHGLSPFGFGAFPFGPPPGAVPFGPPDGYDPATFDPDEPGKGKKKKGKKKGKG